MTLLGKMSQIQFFPRSGGPIPRPQWASRRFPLQNLPPQALVWSEFRRRWSEFRRNWGELSGRIRTRIMTSTGAIIYRLRS